MIRREIIRLTVSNIIFHLEKSNYEMLSSYLNQAQQYYHSLPNGQQQFQEFEFRISEFLLNKLKDGEQSITTEHIVEAKANFRDVFKATKFERENADIPSLGRSISADHNFQRAIWAVLSVLGLVY